MSVDRSVPSRELDVEVARFMGWANIFFGRRNNREDENDDWFGEPPAAWKYPGSPQMRIPKYVSSDDQYYSSMWGWMVEWLDKHCQSWAIGTHDQSGIVTVTFQGLHGELYVGSERTISHALGLAVLAIAEAKGESL